jgi:hypothetical protein
MFIDFSFGADFENILLNASPLMFGILDKPSSSS